MQPWTDPESGDNGLLSTLHFGLHACCFRNVGERVRASGKKGIFPNSVCWDREWPTGPPTGDCQDVEQAIWRFHAELGTTCDGVTQNAVRVLVRGLNVFWNDWQLDYKFAVASTLTFDIVSAAVRGARNVLFNAAGPWRLKGTSGRDAGHSTVIYGYNGDTLQVLLCMGWGSSVADKWVSFPAFSEQTGIFLATPPPLSRRLPRERARGKATRVVLVGASSPSI